MNVPLNVHTVLCCIVISAGNLKKKLDGAKQAPLSSILLRYAFRRSLSFSLSSKIGGASATPVLERQTIPLASVNYSIFGLGIGLSK